MLSIKDLSFGYGGGAMVLDGLSLEIKKGSITTLMGANGCGKTTLLQLLTKNLTPRGGSIRLGGEELCDIPLREYAKKAAIVHQKNTAPDDLTVERLVSYGRLPYSSIFRADRGEESERQIERALALTGLSELRSRAIGTLSGGQRQRAFIAMALAQNTELLFLDEPTTFLDVRYQVEILRLVERLNKDEGISIVMVLHDINQALCYSHELVGMRGGRVAFQGAPGEVITTESINELYGIRLPVVKTDGRLCVMAV